MARTEVKFTRPVQRILTMLLFLGLVGAVVAVLLQDIESVFAANPELNGLIGGVFVIGVLMAFWHVFRLFSAVNWIEALASRTRGIETIPPPGLLVAMDPMRKGAARGLNSQTARAMLDSVATRIDESRDTLRYIAGLLIFLGLLGTFWGLSKTVPAVVDTIRSIQPKPGQEGAALFDTLMTGLDSQLAGMGTAFASSLFGLAGSLVVGFLELMSGGAHNRFYGELETWLSTMTRIGGGDGDEAFASDVAEQLAFVSQQMSALNRIIAEGEDRRAADSGKIADAMAGIERIVAQAAEERETVARAIDSQGRIVAAVERMAESGGGGGGGGGMDAETRRHIRNIDLLIAKLIEENAAGRIETAEALRREVRAVGRAVSDMTSAIGGVPSDN